ncbi:unnamed protein product [Paramecium sonneborni]|uniref:Mini antigen n=1 Tax=Paramecium sonneborni TaxID=65129 RepID=A0A8S1NBU1_9CILI|nr:unnamed protein product [Paramecium sonneborni]
MKIYWLLLCLLVVTNQTATISASQVSQCSCINAMREKDCLNQYCNWDDNSSSCSNKSCQSFGVQECDYLPDPFNCVWNDTSSKCEQFTKCSDYTFNVSQASRCALLVKCQPDYDTINSAEGTLKCKDRTLDAFLSVDNCNMLSYSSCSWYQTPDGTQCVKNAESQTCEPKKIQYCSDYKIIQNCNTYACYWTTNNTCTEKTCSILFENECQYYFSVDSQSVTFCQWNGTSCIDLDLNTLKEEQCLYATEFTYGWNPNIQKCEVCVSPDENSNAFIILFQIIIITIIFN